MKKAILLLLGIIIMTSGCVYSNNTTDISNDTFLNTTKLDTPSNPCQQTEYLSNPNGTNTTCNIIPFAGSKVYYLHSESSDVANSKIMNTTINTSAITTITKLAVPNGNTTIGNWTSPELNVRLIPTGTHLLHFHAYKTGGGASKVVRIFFECFLTNSTGGNKTTMGVSEFSSEITTDTLFESDIFLAVPDMNTNLTDRMQINISYNVTGTGANPDLTFSYDDLTNARFVLPAIQLDTSQFVTYTGATNDLNMGGKNITTTDIHTNNISTGTIDVKGTKFANRFNFSVPSETTNNYFMDLNGTDGVTFSIRTLDNTASSFANFRTESDSDILQFTAHSSARTTSRFGVTVGGWSEIVNTNGATGNTNGLIIGTTANKPILFGTNSLGRMNISADGNITVLTAGKGIILKSPDGTKCGFLNWTNADTFATTATTCP